MATIDTLSERLSALQETTAQLQELIHRLANLKFAPGSVPLTAEGEEESDNVATELSAEISSILREEEEELELLQEEILDLRGGRPGSESERRKQRLKEGTQRLENELKTARTTFRKAQLSAHHSLLAAQKLERQLLVASYAASASLANSTHSLTSSSSSSSDLANQQQHSSSSLAGNKDPRTQLFTPKDLLRHRKPKPINPNDESSAVVNASSDLTLSLRRTHALIAAEVQKSAFASQTLAESSAALAELQKNYEGIDSLLSKSKNLVSTLLTTQKSDTWYLQTSLRLLLVTLGWLVFRRWLYGPLWWVVWLPLKLSYKTTRGVVNLAAGGGGGGQAEMEVVLPGGTTTRVVMGGEESVPTIEVAGPGVGEKQRVEGGEESYVESYVERVGRMVEDTLDQREREEGNKTGEGAVEEEEEREQKNPMKRMWEEDVDGEGEKQQQVELVRDEL
ncbi:Protein transport protein sec20 [Podospora pseudoanserina]|uniref:Protein transport protein sec20 n=1 Tax=Podospora pseudoanserina TaxID=2609844 RepID=A0ABR0INY1_9PEZI|nr:Protein transport protein sec20 [Podospora pseudoanserina]